MKGNIRVDRQQAIDLVKMVTGCEVRKMPDGQDLTALGLFLYHFHHHHYIDVLLLSLLGYTSIIM